MSNSSFLQKKFKSFIFSWTKIQTPTRDFREIFSVETILDFESSADFRKAVCKQRVVERCFVGHCGYPNSSRTVQQLRSTYVDHTNNNRSPVFVWSTKSHADVKQCVRFEITLRVNRLKQLLLEIAGFW